MSPMWLQSLLYVSCMQDTLKDLVSAQGPYRPLGKAQHMCVHVCVKLVLGVQTSALAFLLVTACGIISAVLPHEGEGEDAEATYQEETSSTMPQTCHSH